MFKCTPKFAEWPLDMYHSVRHVSPCIVCEYLHIFHENEIILLCICIIVEQQYLCRPIFPEKILFVLVLHMKSKKISNDQQLIHSYPTPCPQNQKGNIVVVWRLHYINTLKQELSGTKAYKETSEEEKSVVNGHCNHLALKFSVCVQERQDRLPTMYWLPKRHKRPYKARFIANSSSCTTTELSKLLTSCLTAVKNHVIRYCEKVHERSGKICFGQLKFWWGT